MTTTPFVKDPQSVLDYVFDWSAWLAEGETITDSAVTVTSGDVEVDSTSETATAVTAWLSGGTLGTICAVTNHITTNSGREEDKTMRLRIANR